MADGLKKVEIELINNEDTKTLFGANDYYLKMIEDQLDVSIVSRGEAINVSGEEESICIVEEVLNSLLTMVQKGIKFTERDVLYAIELSKENKIHLFETLFETTITKNSRGQTIRAKTLGQKDYVQAMRNNDLVFGIGPAGTGKTYLAVVFAVHALKTGATKKIVLTRPAVEAGESLGFLPGDLKEKVDPYLRPLYDALNDVLGVDQTLRLIENEVIEIAPLAYMRGRTLDNAYVILDEAQNTTPEQMKMFLTRLGFGSKMIVTGDITQVDLPRGIESGLFVVINILKNIKGIEFIHLSGTDVVRHPLVQKIIEAYDA